jgi:hypothetical protein
MPLLRMSDCGALVDRGGADIVTPAHGRSHEVGADLLCACRGEQPPRGRVVDADPRFRALARMLLERLGYVFVGAAADGARALAAARRVRQDRRFSTFQIPGIAGLALARRRRETDSARESS